MRWSSGIRSANPKTQVPGSALESSRRSQDDDMDPEEVGVSTPSEDAQTPENGSWRTA